MEFAAIVDYISARIMKTGRKEAEEQETREQINDNKLGGMKKKNHKIPYTQGQCSKMT